MRGGLRDDDTGVHCFLMLRRQGTVTELVTNLQFVLKGVLIQSLCSLRSSTDRPSEHIEVW